MPEPGRGSSLCALHPTFICGIVILFGVVGLFRWNQESPPAPLVRLSTREFRANTIRSLMFVCVKGCGGIGDRLKGIIGAYDISKRTNRDFYVYAPNTFPEDYGGSNWNKNIPYECKVSLRFALRMNIDKPAHKVLKIAKRSSRCIAVRTNTHMLSSREEQRKLLKELFRPMPQSSETYAAIHLRTGGYGDYKGLDPPRDAIDRGYVLIKALPQNMPIHIVSDSVEAKTELQKACLSCLSDKDAAKHVDRQTVTKRDIAFVWKDFFLLAGATCIAHSRSGFSEVATMWPGSQFNASCSSHFAANGSLVHYAGSAGR